MIGWLRPLVYLHRCICSLRATGPVTLPAYIKGNVRFGVRVRVRARVRVIKVRVRVTIGERIRVRLRVGKPIPIRSRIWLRHYDQ